MKKLFYLAPLLLVLAGCAGVPEATFDLDLATGKTHWQNPKNIAITGLDATIDKRGTARIKVESLTSTNDVNVVAAVAAANAAMAEQFVNALKILEAMA